MISHLWLIGIGTGAMSHITLEGQQAIRDAAVILLPRKGAGKDDLATVRLKIIAAAGAQAKVVPFEMPVRDDTLPYQERVALWHDQIALAWQGALAETEITGPVALLVWGDPGLYDSTLRIAERLSPRPTIRVVPGVTALQALTAAHAIPFNTIDGSVCVTTGQQLRTHALPGNAETVVVMLDGKCSFMALDDPDLMIWWGAFLGMPEQITIKGHLRDVGAQIVEKRAKARADHGWIMDTYLLRKGDR
ncbi:precorrin-6A synthase (deacetylating) [Roseobacter denitrificans]|uniref:Precorrin-6A synthase [deacetylating] n=1 Tax=Roseobacter denitrificans (strain ATCC 33942 / OCh 114) TaxID=375451 RepID=Q161R3_ROSDO|nr:precorrin-6A synthase (deacetylating) [Roseobacter denitrificans]ABG33280.1 precorrin-6A synthase (deacetylating), putative [Roseobacter denitrificans OCh 114]AVL52620.1 precorrin-6A synthase (deacetylating) [Roseobacter denitrificans]SFG22066.1 precorrin-6A synthase (deacetylating) [Roseobacter denitrificans OCh 114]